MTQTKVKELSERDWKILDALLAAQISLNQLTRDSLYDGAKALVREAIKEVQS